MSLYGRSIIAKKLLLIAYHFPPYQGSTGIHRTLAFAKYLRESDWAVTVLTASIRAYASTNPSNNALIPNHVKVVRAFALDAQRHLSLFGRYCSLLAVPDRWQSWILGGFLSGTGIIRRWSPNAIMSTYPIASAHVIAAALQRTFGLPWIADLRDPMAQDAYPPDVRIRNAYLSVERQIFRYARRVTVATVGTAELYRNRYPLYPRDSVVVIPNGFDEDMMAESATAPPTPRDGRLRFLHSGLLYPSERDPTAFFAAIAELRDEKQLDSSEIEFVFRGCGHEQTHMQTLDRLSLHDLVKLQPTIGYADALTEMLEADACMLFQSSNCNLQIPAKLYEYLRCRKPIFALTDPVGDTGRLLSELKVSPITPLDQKQQIKSALRDFIRQVRAGSVTLPQFDQVSRYSRRSLTRDLAATLDQVTGAASRASHGE